MTDWPAGSEDERPGPGRADVKVTPAGRFGLGTLMRPWAGRLSTTATFWASTGPGVRDDHRIGVGAPAMTELTPSVFEMARRPATVEAVGVGGGDR